uniref:Uncharacterized protein n=1 Tax=Glossina austeni TaxID=7395 RepID=A0A1A9VSW8_GLOAU
MNTTDLIRNKVVKHNFSVYTASTIAASSIAAALSGLNWHLRTGFIPFQDIRLMRTRLEYEI